MDVSKDWLNFLGAPIISGMGKATDKNFQTLIYKAHRVVTFATAQLLSLVAARFCVLLLDSLYWLLASV